MLEAKNVHKVYHTGSRQIPVLKGVNLKIEKGKFIAIVGPSGAGKSTLLHILGGLDIPAQGQVIFAGENLYAQSDASLAKLRNRAIGFVFQFYHLLSEFTVLENVCMPALINGGAQSFAGFYEAALKILAKVGLSQRLGHFPSELSGGERQRVAIARALINNPAILFCDEPTGNLDSQAGRGVVELLRGINQQEQTTVVLVTHNVELAKTADCMYQLKDGILVN